MSAEFDWTFSNWSDYLKVVVAVGFVAIKQLFNYLEKRRADKEVTAAEEKVFKVPVPLMEKISELSETQENLHNQAKEIAKVLEESKDFLQKGILTNLYNKQIEKYQTETRARAGWSFLIAIVAMCLGLAFVFWGGLHLLTTDTWRGVAAGSAISAIGGSVSAYIAKTFLNIHKISLAQLNHYFRQPVLNSHILTAQSIADQMTTSESRQKGYESILARVLLLIRYDADGEAVQLNNDLQSDNPGGEAHKKPTTPRVRKKKPGEANGGGP